MNTCINNEERKGRERKGKGEEIVGRGSVYGIRYLRDLASEREMVFVPLNTVCESPHFPVK